MYTVILQLRIFTYWSVCMLGARGTVWGHAMMSLPAGPVAWLVSQLSAYRVLLRSGILLYDWPALHSAAEHSALWEVPRPLPSLCGLSSRDYSQVI